jgi:hypothetical protein
MELEDFLEPEIAVVAAVAAAVFSPQVRGWLRRGAVYGMAGALVAGDVVTGFARGVGRGMQQAAGAVQDTTSAMNGDQHQAHAEGAAESGSHQGE